MACSRFNFPIDTVTAAALWRWTRHKNTSLSRSDCSTRKMNVLDNSFVSAVLSGVKHFASCKGARIETV